MPQKNWLSGQRVAGGSSLASSMLRTQANTEDYIKHITKVVQEKRGLPLSVEKSLDGYEVVSNENIVWFGRDIDVELLRATKVSALEDYLNARLDLLVELGLVNVQEEVNRVND